MKEQSTSIKVAVRFRPLVEREIRRGDKAAATVNEAEQQVTIGEKSAFTFDRVFGSNSSQSSVYDSCVKALVEGTFDGYNATVFAYGQTGSGKTHTMGIGIDRTGNISQEDHGIVPRAVEHLFNEIEARKRKANESGLPPPVFEVSVTFVELYNENIFNLLDAKRSNVRLLASEEIKLSGVKSTQVLTAEDVMEKLRFGAANRTVGATKMNNQSSRSHAIFSIYLKQKRSAVTMKPSSMMSATNLEFLNAKFHFVDLAGSESSSKTGATGTRATEASNINKSLLALGNVLNDLASTGKTTYRTSKLTQMLKDSLGGNSRTVMIACASPSSGDLIETRNTMQYANRTKNIKNKVVANQDQSSPLVADLLQRVAELEAELHELKSYKEVITEDVAVLTDPDLKNADLFQEIKTLTSKIKDMQDDLDRRSEAVTVVSAENPKKFARLKIAILRSGVAAKLKEVKNNVFGKVSSFISKL